MKTNNDGLVMVCMTLYARPSSCISLGFQGRQSPMQKVVFFVPVVSVCKMHIKKHVKLDATTQDRDFFLHTKYVLNIYSRLSKGNYQIHKKYEMSVNIWYQKNTNNFLFYQNPNDVDVPFIIGIQTKWMLERMVKLSHNNLIAMDSTFNTNKYRVCVFSVIVLI